MSLIDHQVKVSGSRVQRILVEPRRANRSHNWVNWCLWGFLVVEGDLTSLVHFLRSHFLEAALLIFDLLVLATDYFDDFVVKNVLLAIGRGG